MKKLSLSKFDLGVIIAFVVIGLLGGGAWYYLSGQLQDAQDDAKQAKADFDRDSVAGGDTGQKIVVSEANKKILQDNIDLIRSTLDPIIQNKLEAKTDLIFNVQQKDPVAWKHDLDNEVKRLTDAAKSHNVKLNAKPPVPFYFGFSRYAGGNPQDEQTVILGKQLLVVDQLSTILIDAQVKAITAIRRSYEEEKGSGGGGGQQGGDTDRFGGSSFSAPGDAYTSYPFEIEFDANTDSLRTVIDKLVASPFVLVIRAVAVNNLKPISPQLDYLDKTANPGNQTSMVDSAPGQVAATTSTLGPQFLFGDATLHVKIRVDMIEWQAQVAEQSGVKK